MPTSTKVKNLNINELTEAQYDAAVQGGVIGANELSVLTDVSYVEPSDLATVATTGDYSDLINRPTNLVSTNTAQTISGMKTFSGDITLSGTTSIKNNTGGTNYTMLYRDATTIHVGASTSVLKLEGSGTRPAYNNDSLALLSDVTGGLPSQTGNEGKFLTTDGTDASWAENIEITNSLVRIDTQKTNSYAQVKIGAKTNAAFGTGAIGIGTEVGNTGNHCINIGNSSSANGIGAIATGQQCRSSGTYSIAVGNRARATQTGAIQINVGANSVTNSDANTVKIANANGNFELMSADGTIPSDRLVHAINKYSTMPTAASTNEGWIVQFTGTTDSTYTHGHLYECVSDGQDPATYSWAEVSMGGGGGSYLPLTGGTLTGDVSLNGQTAILFDGGSKGYMRSAGIVYQTELGYKDGSSYRKIFTLDFGSGAIVPSVNASYHTLGKSSLRWGNVYTTKINNGADITVPSVAGEMAVKQVNTTITLAAADWSSNTQTVNVTGMTADGVVMVSPDPTDQSAYTSAGILCTAQAAGSLTFTCDTVPSGDLSVNVVML